MMEADMKFILMRAKKSLRKFARIFLKRIWKNSKTMQRIIWEQPQNKATHLNEMPPKHKSPSHHTVQGAS